jgi:hypothetical protein
MNIPRYWARASAEVPQGKGKPLALSACGWSLEGQMAAEAHARERLAAVVARVQAGEPLPQGYGYGDRPVREEIVQEVGSRSGDGPAVITRNSYGALVLNATKALFLDVDIPARTFGERIRRLFGSAEPSPEERVKARLKDVLQQVSHASFRLYRTAAGFRVLATDPEFPLGDQTVAGLLADPIVDRAYARLCEVQKSYRARLTPKPWRCGCKRPPHRFPFASDSDRRAFDLWVKAYERAAATRATCALLEEIGSGRLHRDVAPLLAIHDDVAKVSSGLPLA